MAMKSDEVDRISSLPDPIIHHIFSYLDTRKLVQTSILSNRWRYLWTSTPYLSFHHQYVPEDGTNQLVMRYKFMSFVDQVFLRREDSNIHKLTLTCTCNIGLRASRLYEWLIAASKHHVHELSLEVYTKEPLEVPREFFTSGITAVKIIHRSYRSYCGMQMPISMCSSATIKSLYLEGVKLPNVTPNGELTFSCPVLEDFVIHYCDSQQLRLTILAPLLKRLGLFHNRCPFRTISICCPNLTSLKYKTWIFSDWSAENLLALTSAHIDVCGMYNMKAEVSTQSLTNVLKGVRNVKALRISSSVLKVINYSPDILEMLPNLFHNMTDFMLDDGIDTCTNAIWIVNLLKRLPCIEAFVWKRYQYHVSIKPTKRVKDLEADLPVERKFYCLKTVEIHDVNGTEDELEFLEFIFKTYIVLKEMIIMPTRLDRKKLLKFKKKLLALPRASSSLLIHWREA